GTGKGTCDLDDWENADLLLVMGVNAASNAPRMLTSLAEAHRRGARIGPTISGTPPSIPTTTAIAA
ncbi:MAG TPA: hypothetical protein VF926_15875, partial [Mycobacterium sp.]